MQEESTMYPSDQYPPSQMYSQQPVAQNQFLYYPKPYSPANSALKPIQPAAVIPKQPLMMQPPQQQQAPRTAPISQQQPQRQFVQNGAPPPQNVQQQPQQQQPRVAGYNQHHWLLHEAELRRQIDSIDPRKQQQQQQQQLSNGVASAPTQQQQPQSKNSPGFLSVSGKKKCSSCMEELGKGCAAMVVESLSLYYHINCFRCSVCNVQLGKSWKCVEINLDILLLK